MVPFSLAVETLGPLVFIIIYKNLFFRIRLDGTRLFKVHLDKTQQTNIEHKTDTFAGVYKKLTGKEVNFEFPEPYL